MSDTRSSDESNLELLIASRFPIIAIETYEEERALSLLAACARRYKQTVRAWSIAYGLAASDGNGFVPGTQDPAAALRAVAGEGEPGVFALLDFQPYLSNPVNVRLLKEIASHYERLPRTLVLIGHRADVPDEIKKLSASLELSLPDENVILGIIKSEVGTWQRRNGGRELKGEREVFDLMLRHLIGLTESDVRRLVRFAIQEDGLLRRDDLPRLIKQKHAILARDSVLSLEIETSHFADVAGLRNLREWLDRRRSVFLGQQGASAALDVPKGIMLLGVQGCGKSLAAKAVAGAWSIPLMRLDFGALYDKFLGETERKLRDALKAADAMAPCVLWVDEIEKGVSSNKNASDGGESKRLLGTLLTWMSERRSRVFIVATSNDIESLPPELIRKGRLDEIFFVDLPDAESRQEILRIHLRKRALDANYFDVPNLAEQAAGFSGAEIEQAVVSALFEANSRGCGVTGEMIAEEMKKTKPLSVVMAERIAGLRVWARDRTVMAG